MGTTHPDQSFRVGDHVVVRLGTRTLTGVIIEDRGPIGAQGRHLFQVNIPMEPFEPMTMELPDEQFERVEDTPVHLTKEQIRDYLVHGGLVAILQSNLSGRGSNVWLCRDNVANVTHTFTAERGVIGGKPAPFFALQNDKVFAPKRNEVASFVESFGLSRQEAEAVIEAVGTAP